MTVLMQRTFTFLSLCSLLIIFSTGCGKSDDDEPSLEDIPHYPNASKGESMEHSAIGGFVGGKLEQYTTTDSFDKVVEFYTNALSSYQSETLTNSSELGQQMVISMPQKNGIMSVAIQEFRKGEKVNITFMSVSN